MRKDITSSDLSFASLQGYDGLALPFVTGFTLYGTTNQYLTMDVTTGTGLTIGRPAVVLCANGITSGLSVSAEL